MTINVRHAVTTGAPADPDALVDGPAWDAAHVVTGLVASDVGFTPSGSISADNVADGLAELDTETPKIPDLAAVAFSGSANDLVFQTGVFTPAASVDTPGDLARTYTLQSGFYFKIGRVVFVWFRINLSAWTWTTASGNVVISGLPFATTNTTNYFAVGDMTWRGITKATFTQIEPRIGANASSMNLIACGSGVAAANVVAADIPSGGTPQFTISMTYLTD